MKVTPVLSISGSDTTSRSGIQADVKTISDLGGYAHTAVSCVSIRDANGITSLHPLPPSLVIQQVSSVIRDVCPRSVKVGLVPDAQAVRLLRGEIIGCKSIVFSPGIFSSDGSQLVDDTTIEAIRTSLIPIASLLMLRCNEAERILGISILSNDDMLLAARRLTDMGASNVLLRGGHLSEGRLTALFYSSDSSSRFFNTYHVEGWQKRGVGAALSTAIATRLALGDEMLQAISNAHKYVHSQIVYSVSEDDISQRAADIYHAFMNLIAANFASAHDVSFYAERLFITPRYLSKVTDKVVDKSPKQVIADYLIAEAKLMLANSRLTIQEVSSRLGFSSQSKFSHFFSQHSGSTPTDFRAGL